MDGWIQKPHLYEERLKSLEQFILRKKTQVLTTAFKIMHDLKEVARVLLDVSLTEYKKERACF